MLFFFLILVRRILFLSSPAVVLFIKSKNDGDNTIVIIHGLGRTAFSMLIPAVFFRLKSYNVFLYDYVSGRAGFNEHSRNLASFLSTLKKRGFKKIFFLTHSLGGILLRVVYANFAELFPPGRTVMLAPPNNGSKAADFFSKISLLRKFLLPLCEIRSSDSSFVRSLPPPHFEHGVIAGSIDRKVNTDEAKTGTMKDFLVIKTHHTFIMNRIDVLNEALSFLQNGNFGKN